MCESYCILPQRSEGGTRNGAQPDEAGRSQPVRTRMAPTWPSSRVGGEAWSRQEPRRIHTRFPWIAGIVDRVGTRAVQMRGSKQGCLQVPMCLRDQLVVEG